MTPDSRKVGTGMAASPSPFLTPRPEKRRGTLDWNSNHKDKDKEVNVQVVLRCRVYHMKCFRISKQPLLLPHQLIQNSYFCKNQLGKTKFLMLKLVQQARGDVVPRLLKVQKSSFNSGIACRRFKSHVMQLEALLRGVAPMLTAIGLVPSFLATDFDYGLLVYSTSKECCVV
ncbi:uncharacterized protein LOC133710273 isoform X1 [Rosa rugosa]|uniref:uncharacterized protein LOC133710273 isoform X1 n=2 Tax=Rosa rugosa TaxID=74645 RepID=UPI002B417626|nr:uncharacterized protein LOC133710273 isoform X1 [Rosa rugosa]XP_061992286.1 uncharacterized protein LOC133710273 isoform X1 [Rosa rugosa]XP_061992287.1 uncharacterized protein LOC133710273 isoform X1 [Rosa rugosa]